MDVRRATPEDFPAILGLVREYPDKLIQVHLPEPAEFFVAIEGGEIVGCCALEVYSKRLAEIRSLAVTKQFQGKGIATKLVVACVEEAKKQKIYELLAIAGSEEFFARFGFHTFNKEKFALINILGK